eukprot:TRINITY_DN164_c3_g1_i1.p1 TRINITY_DN164_c3_g1~~TRINITY_DN164_c3_g1_i1.p1  ORF type:complete len:1928 (-),score=532.89 TRINITY_DN164_c3_g1_i1:275-5581(-)
MSNHDKNEEARSNNSNNNEDNKSNNNNSNNNNSINTTTASSSTNPTTPSTTGDNNNHSKLDAFPIGKEDDSADNYNDDSVERELKQLQSNSITSITQEPTSSISAKSSMLIPSANSSPKSRHSEINSNISNNSNHEKIVASKSMPGSRVVSALSSPASQSRSLGGDLEVPNVGSGKYETNIHLSKKQMSNLKLKTKAVVQSRTVTVPKKLAKVPPKLPSPIDDDTPSNSRLGSYIQSYHSSLLDDESESSEDLVSAGFASEMEDDVIESDLSEIPLEEPQAILKESDDESDFTDSDEDTSNMGTSNTLGSVSLMRNPYKYNFDEEKAAGSSFKEVSADYKNRRRRSGVDIAAIQKVREQKNEKEEKREEPDAKNPRDMMEVPSSTIMKLAKKASMASIRDHGFDITQHEEGSPTLHRQPRENNLQMLLNDIVKTQNLNPEDKMKRLWNYGDQNDSLPDSKSLATTEPNSSQSIPSAQDTFEEVEVLDTEAKINTHTGQNVPAPPLALKFIEPRTKPPTNIQVQTPPKMNIQVPAKLKIQNDDIQTFNNTADLRRRRSGATLAVEIDQHSQNRKSSLKSLKSPLLPIPPQSKRPKIKQQTSFHFGGNMDKKLMNQWINKAHEGRKSEISPEDFPESFQRNKGTSKNDIEDDSIKVNIRGIHGGNEDIDETILSSETYVDSMIKNRSLVSNSKDESIATFAESEGEPSAIAVKTKISDQEISTIEEVDETHTNSTDKESSPIQVDSISPVKLTNSDNLSTEKATSSTKLVQASAQSAVALTRNKPSRRTSLHVNQVIDSGSEPGSDEDGMDDDSGSSLIMTHEDTLQSSLHTANINFSSIQKSGIQQSTPIQSYHFGGKALVPKFQQLEIGLRENMTSSSRSRRSGAFQLGMRASSSPKSGTSIQTPTRMSMTGSGRKPPRIPLGIRRSRFASTSVPIDNDNNPNNLMNRLQSGQSGMDKAFDELQIEGDRNPDKDNRRRRRSGALLLRGSQMLRQSTTMEGGGFRSMVISPGQGTRESYNGIQSALPPSRLSMTLADASPLRMSISAQSSSNPEDRPQIPDIVDDSDSSIDENDIIHGTNLSLTMVPRSTYRFAERNTSNRNSSVLVKRRMSSMSSTGPGPTFRFGGVGRQSVFSTGRRSRSSRRGSSLSQADENRSVLPCLSENSEPTIYQSTSRSSNSTESSMLASSRSRRIIGSPTTAVIRMDSQRSKNTQNSNDSHSIIERRYSFVEDDDDDPFNERAIEASPRSAKMGTGRRESNFSIRSRSNTGRNNIELGDGTGRSLTGTGRGSIMERLPSQRTVSSYEETVTEVSVWSRGGCLMAAVRSTSARQATNAIIMDDVEVHYWRHYCQDLESSYQQYQTRQEEAVGNSRRSMHTKRSRDDNGNKLSVRINSGRSQAVNSLSITIPRNTRVDIIVSTANSPSKSGDFFSELIQRELVAGHPIRPFVASPWIYAPVDPSEEDLTKQPQDRLLCHPIVVTELLRQVALVRVPSQDLPGLLLPWLMSRRRVTFRRKKMWSAAVKIQSLHRGFQSRNFVRLIRSTQKERGRQNRLLDKKLQHLHKHFRVQKKGASMFQALWRGFHVRSTVHRWGIAAKRIQVTYRKWRMWIALNDWQKWALNGPQVDKIYNRCHLINDHYLLLTARQCGQHILFTGTDLGLKAQQYNGLITAGEIRALIRKYPYGDPALKNRIRVTMANTQGLLQVLIWRLALVDRVKTVGFKPEAEMVLVLDVPATGYDNKDFSVRLLKSERRKDFALLRSGDFDRLRK